MSPRPYRTAKRREAAEETRARVIDATRDILDGANGLARLSIDAVAQRAGVARMTVYYQFGSKAGLLEAFFDEMSDRGPFRRIPDAMRQADPMHSLDMVIEIFCEFWARNSAAHARLLAASRLDRDLEAALHQRIERGRAVVRAIVGRLGPWKGKRGARRAEDLVDALFAVVNFSTFEALGAHGRSVPERVRILQTLARATVDALR